MHAASPANTDATPRTRTYNPAKVIPYIAMHLACVSVFFVPFAWELVGLCAALYVVRMFGITAGYHRYFSHKAYRTSRAFQFLLAWIANTSLMRGPITWAAAHRYHHAHSDTEQDLHSPRQSGFWFSHTGWFLTREYEEAELASVKDLLVFPELRWINEHYYVPAYALAALLFAIGGLPWLVWGFVLSTVLAWHGTFTINSLSHVYGSRRFETGDDSRNNFLLALITLGEGWHNNHHHQMWSARQGFFWWELDVSYAVLWVLSKLGLVWNLKQPKLADGP